MRLPQCTLIGLALSLSALAECGAASPQKTCAVVPADWSDFDTLTVLPLLETALSQTGRLRLVEREHIQAVLNERQVQAALSAAGLRARRDLGTLMRADYLAIVSQAGTQARPSLELTFVETRTGLRLFRDRMILDERAPAAQLEPLVIGLTEAQDRLDDGVRCLLAILPFESEDFSYEHAHLMSAYAMIVEQALSRYPGSLVVELAEARAVAKELALSDGALTVQRPRPFYVIGKLKNIGEAGARRVKVVLELRRDDEVVHSTVVSAVVPDEVVTVLQRCARDIYKIAANRPPPRRADPGREAAVLRQRADRFARLGHWTEAATLAEASLLLDHEQPGVRFTLVQFYLELVLQHYTYSGDTPRDFEARNRRAMQYYAAGLSHLEAVLRVTDEPLGAMRLAQCYFGSMSDLSDCVRRGGGPELVALLDSLYRQRHDLLVRALEANSSLQRLRGAAFGYVHFVSNASHAFPLEHRLAARLRMMRATQFSPDAKLWARQLMTWGIRDRAYETPEYARFLDAIAALPNEKVKEAVADQRIRIASLNRPRKPSKAARPDGLTETPAKTEPPDVRFEPLQLTRTDIRPIKSTYSINHSPLRGCMPCGQGLDVFWALRDVFLMRTPGELRRVCVTNGEYVGRKNLCFDGKYLWILTQEPGVGVYVVDPASEKVWTLSAANGLPKRPRVVAPLEAGRVFMSGAFGPQKHKYSTTGLAPVTRSWCALVEFDGAGNAAVDVFHEARIALHYERDASAPSAIGKEFVMGGRDDRAGLEHAFVPGKAIVVTDPASREQRILLTRAGGRSYRPLIIDPDTRKITLLDGPRPSLSQSCIRGGAVYWVGHSKFWGVGQLGLWRVGFPNWKTELVTADVPETGLPVLLRDRLFLFGRSVWISPIESIAFDKLSYDQPRTKHSDWGYSTHYGLLRFTRDGAFRMIVVDDARKNEGAR